jgi:hypothetical protein
MIIFEFQKERHRLRENTGRSARLPVSVELERRRGARPIRLDGAEERPRRALLVLLPLRVP